MANGKKKPKPFGSNIKSGQSKAFGEGNAFENFKKAFFGVSDKPHGPPVGKNIESGKRIRTLANRKRKK